MFRNHNPVTLCVYEVGDYKMISLLVTLVIIGLILWLVNNYIPMDAKIKSILNVVVVVMVIIWLLSAFGIFTGNRWYMR